MVLKRTPAFLCAVFVAACTPSTAPSKTAETDRNAEPGSPPPATSDPTQADPPPAKPEPMDPAMGPETAPPLPDANAPDAEVPPRPADAAPPLPAFPLDAVKGAKAEKYADRGGHVEGISWREGEVFFSVIPGGFFRIDRDKKISKYADLKSNGSFLLADGRLLVCDDRFGIVQVSTDGKVGVVGSGGRCNDVTVDKWGNIYFSDFGNSITRITPDGTQTKPLTGLNKPNGIEVDPDSRYLYFMPRPNNIFRVAIDEDGPMGEPEKVGQLSGVTDGCAFDAYGNLWVTVYYDGKIGVFDPEKMEIVAYVDGGGRGLTNMTFGGSDRDVLYTTVDNKGIFAVPAMVRGFAGHPGASKYTIKRTLD